MMLEVHDLSRTGFFIILISSFYTIATSQDLSALESLLSPLPTDIYPTIVENEENNSLPGEEFAAENENGKSGKLTWTKWSDWSACESSGFRVRSRSCPTNANCQGDDVQLRKCNAKDTTLQSMRYRYKYSKKYVEQCKKNKEMGKSLSCKLYLENPDLAYDIFRKNSCFFTANNAEGGLFLVDNGTAVPLPDVNATNSDEDFELQNDPKPKNKNMIISVDSRNSMSFRSEKFLDSQTTGEEVKGGQNEIDDAEEGEDDEEDTSGNHSVYSKNVLKALLKERECKAHCENTLNQATRLWALGTRRSRSADSTIALLKRNGRLTTGIGVMFFEYNTCISNCHSLGTTFSMLSGRNKSRTRVDPTTEIRTILKSLATNSGPKRKNREAENPTQPTNVESLCSDKSPMCRKKRQRRSTENEEIQRQKRQINKHRYESPCFSTENQVPVREIEQKAKAELFFFESYEQRFDCRKCRGTRRKNTDLYFPKEQIRQQKNNKPAYCRQGFLKRHALFIIENPNGRYKFRSGEKFSIESRTFEIESHCEIVVLK